MSNDNTAHLHRFRHCFLAELDPFDWEQDLSVVHQRNVGILKRLLADTALMRDLILNAREDPYLWAKCEEDVVEDKIVLWDDIGKNIRIRLRMAVACQQRLAHCHRFSFTNLVVRGTYIHWLYRPMHSFDPLTRLNDVQTVAQHVDKAGDAFTIHHETLHSTPFPEPGTISLVLRGNPVKDRAPVMFKESRGRAAELAKVAQRSGERNLDVEPEVASAGDFFWRVGEEMESRERRIERQMRPQQIDYWLTQLEEYGIL